MATTEFGFFAQISGLTVKFRVTGEVPATAQVDWDFGDSSQESDKLQVSHTYTDSGFYPVKASYVDEDGNTVAYLQTILVNTITHTSLTGSIYDLIDRYIPADIKAEMSLTDKQSYITKWQLYIHPLVNHFIPLEECYNELYYEGLENQLIMELAVWDFLDVKLYELLLTAGKYLSGVTIQETDEDDDEGDNKYRGDRIKKIVTGPTEVDYYDSLSESAANLYSAYWKAFQPGGLLDTLKDNLCMLAERLVIYLPLCNRVTHRKVPRVVNRRNPGKLGGPNPTYPINGGETTIL